MYAYFIGKVTSIGTDSIVLETNGIGYNIIMSGRDMSELIPGDEVKVYTYTSVREDAIWLYGFLDSESLSFFKLLLPRPVLAGTPERPQPLCGARNRRQDLQVLGKPRQDL